MASFFDSSHGQRLFPDSGQHSPAAFLFLSGVDPEALFKALAAGWITAEAVVEDVNGVPALGRWMDRFKHSSRVGPDDEPPCWPITPDGDWSDVASPWQQGSLTNPAFDSSACAQWVAAVCVAMAPPGLGHARWEPSSSDSNNESTTCSVLGLAVELGWLGVISQLLRRPDAPSPGEAARLTGSRLIGCWSLSSHTPVNAQRDNQRLPMLHWALEHDHVATARMLLEYGVSPSSVDENGLPAWMRCKNVKSLRCVLDYVQDPAQVTQTPLSPAQWWAAALGSAATAEPLLQELNAWIARRLSPEKRLALVMSSVASGLPSATLASLKTQLAASQVSPTQAWEADGKQWTLATAALAWEPFIGDKHCAAQVWALGRGQLGKQPPVFGDVPNPEALWWLSFDWPKERKEWARRHAIAPADPLASAQAMVHAFLEQYRKEIPGLFGAKVDKNAHARLLSWSWKVLRRLPDHVIHAPEANALRVSVLAAAKNLANWDVSMPMALWCVDRARALVKEGAAEEAGVWATAGVRLWLAHTPQNLMVPGADGADALSRTLAPSLREMLDTGSIKGMRSVASQAEMCMKVSELVESGLVFHGLSLPVPILEEWEAHPATTLLVPCLKAAAMSASMSAPQVKTSRPRM